MKKEEAMFEISVFSHNSIGEKYRVTIYSLAKRSDVLNICEKAGVLIHWNAPYSMRKGKSYPIESLKNFEDLTGVRLGEFKYEAHVNIARVNLTALVKNNQAPGFNKDLMKVQP